MSKETTESKPGNKLLEPAEFFQVGTQNEGFRIYLRYELFRALDDFAVRDTAKEQVGLLVGRLGQSEDGAFLVVEDAIESGSGDQRTGRLQSAAWQRARRVAKTRHPNRLVVGWFHTHPGTGLDLSDEEKQVHEKYFAEDWQIVYVVDPLRRDRNFHLREKGEILPVSGFRIFGKEGGGSIAPESIDAVPQIRSSKPDEQLKERYLERSLDKIQKSARRRAVGWMDYLVVALLVANLGFMVLRPTPPVQVDTSQLSDGQAQLSEQLTSLRSRMEKLERHLAELQLLDEQLQLAVDEEEPAPESTPTEKPKPRPEASPAASPKPSNKVASTAKPDEGTRVRLHRVASGDTLGTIAEKYYESASPTLVSSLGRFNKLKGPNYAIFPGDTVKVPEQSRLPK